MKRSFKLIAILMALLFVSCGGSSDAPASGDSGSAGGENKLVVSKNADLTSMDPQLATDGLSFEAIASCIEGLYQFDENSVPQPALAESYEESEDHLTWTFHLRDAKWSNGDPVTADDFVYAWQRLGTIGSEYGYMLEVAGVKNGAAVSQGKMPAEELGVRAVDAKTFEVTLERPVPFFLKLMVFPSFYPANKAFVEAQGAEYGLSPEKTLYCGPFVWKEWFSGSSFLLEKNPDYWDKDAVKLDAIEFKVALDPQSAVLDYESGSTDYVALMGELVSRYESDPGYNKQLGSYLWYLEWNHSTGKFNDNILKAVSLAFNREQIADNVLQDGSIPAYFFVPRKLAFDESGKDFRDNDNIYFQGGKEEAVKYWEAAKEEMGSDTFTFELLFEDSEQSKKVAEFLKSEIEGTLPGMTVELKSQPKKTRLQLMNEKKFECVLTRWGPDYADPMTYLELYESTQDRGGYKNPAFDEMMQKAKSGTMDPKDRWKLLIEAEALLCNDPKGPVGVYQTGAAELWNTAVHGYINNTVGVPYLYKSCTVDK